MAARISKAGVCHIEQDDVFYWIRHLGFIPIHSDSGDSSSQIPKFYSVESLADVDFSCGNGAIADILSGAGEPAC